MNTQIRIQIQITHRKNSNIVQKRFNSGYDDDEAARDILPPSRQEAAAAAGQGIPKPGADLSIGLTRITGITRHG